MITGIEQGERVKLTELENLGPIEDAILNSIYNGLAKLIHPDTNHAACSLLIGTNTRSSNQELTEPLMEIVDMAKASGRAYGGRSLIQVSAGLWPVTDSQPAELWHTHGTVDGFSVTTLMGTVGVKGDMSAEQALDLQATLQQTWNGTGFTGVPNAKTDPQPPNSLVFIPWSAAHRSPNAQELKAVAGDETHRLWIPIVVNPNFSTIE